ncbi:MAG: alpha/beta hydrolase family protein [Candidatus Promineifilaceae bacterium]
MTRSSNRYLNAQSAFGTRFFSDGRRIAFISDIGENASDYRRAHREAEYGSLENHRDVLESISPMHQVEEIRAPLMVIHEANDPRVPLSEAEQLVDALQARELPVAFMVFDDEGHGIHKLKNKRVAYAAVVDSLSRHL